jgi:hypothetical protein
MLSSAFRDATGVNRENAAIAIRFIRARTDWSFIPLSRRLAVWGVAGPPVEVRNEGWPLTFEHCARLLGWNPEQLRQQGIPITTSVSELHHWAGTGGLRDWRRWRAERWERQRQLDARDERRTQRLAAMRAAQSQQMRESQPRMMVIKAHA